MATENQGIMSLPQGGEKEAPQMPQMGLEDSYDAVKGGLQDVSPQASAAMQQTLDQITPQLDQLSDEQLDSLIQVFQYLHDHPEEYDQRVKELVDKGVVSADTMPDKYDPEVLATLIIVFMEAKRQRQAGNQREAEMAMPQPPATMARGGIAEAARMVSSRGRSGDSMLAHITPREAALLRKHGGMGTINPATGLPEYGFFSSVVGAVTGAVKSVVGAVTNVVSSVVNTVKSVVQSPVGKILGTIALATVLGPGAMGFAGMGLGAAALPLASGAITALSGGNLKDVLRSAAVSYLGAPGGPVESFIGNAGAAMGVTNAAGQAAINAGLTGAGVGLLTGQSLKDSVKSGLIAGAIQGGATGIQKGFGTQLPNVANAPGGIDVAKPSTPSDVTNQINTKDFDQFKPTGSQYGAFGESPTGAGAAGGAQQAGAAAKFSPIPTIGESASRIGGGLSDIMQGNFSQGFEGVKGGLGDLLAPGKMTPEQLAKSPAFESARANGATYSEAIKAASDAYNPSLLRTYGPGIAAGLAATGAMGGFQPNTPPSSALAEKLSGTPGEDLIKANPRKYITQGLPGVEYDETGNIIGSKPWSPSATMDDVRVPSTGRGTPTGQYQFANLQPPMGSMYTPGAGTLGQNPQIYQPYNTPDMYTNLMFPRRAAEGGIMNLDEPVHMFLGGAALEAAKAAAAAALANQGPPQGTPAAGPVGTPAAGPVGTPAANPTPIALTGPEFISPDQVVGKLPPAPVTQPAPYGPGLSGNPPPPNPLDEVRVRPGQRTSMTPAQRAAFAQQFARNLSFNPQTIQQQTPVARPPIQPQYNNISAYSNFQRPTGSGLASLAEGGYPRRTGQISGPGTETSDSIPAMLSDGEFVMTAKAVRGAGKGSRRAGAKKMYALMHQLERNASRG